MKYRLVAILIGLLCITNAMTQVVSDFEGGTLDGWVSEGDGVENWEAATGNPGGCMRVDDDATGNMNRAYAPLKFLGNWSSATISDTLRADIYLNPISTSYLSTNFVFRIAGPGGQATGILNPTPPFNTWHTYKISLNPADWQLNSGSWAGLMEQVTALIVTMEYIGGDEFNRLDNVHLSFSPLSVPVAPVVCSTFEGGDFEGWSFTGTGSVSNASSGGNPGRYVLVANGTATAYSFAPPKFLGDWSGLDNHLADIRFDLKLTSTSGSLLVNDAFLRISGPGGVAKIALDSAVLGAIGVWDSYSYPVESSAWVMESGSWSSLIAQVTELRLCLEFLSGSEAVGLDNFCITNTPPVAAFTADYTYTFAGNPVLFDNQSTGGPTQWSWTFGDGGTSMNEEPSHTYSQPGVKTVELLVTNQFGSDTEVKNNYIEVAGIEDCQKFSDAFPTTTIHPAWIRIQGTWVAASGILKQTSNYYGTTIKDGCYALTGSLLWENYTISADLLSTDNDIIGLVYHYQDNQNMYMFAWNLETPGRTLYRWVNGVQVILASDNVGYTANTWYGVEMGGFNGNIRVTVDGTPIFDVWDTTFLTGKAGLFCRGNDESHYDNVVVECAITDSLILTNDTIPSGVDTCYEATGVITIGGEGTPFTIEAGGMVNLVAGQKISLLPNTTVVSDGYLHAWISDGNYYCQTPPLVKEVATEPEPAKPGDNDDDLMCFPNPTTGKLTLKLSGPVDRGEARLEIYNTTGKRVLQHTFHSQPYSTDLSALPPGIYFLVLHQGEGVLTGKTAVIR
jgi:PKD repeat protein